MDDRKAALLLAVLALGGALTRLALTPGAGTPPGEVRLSRPPPPPTALQDAAARAARLARPLMPGERIDLDHADVTEITRLPRIGPALAQRIVAWREAHGPFGGLERLDSVPGIGPKLLAGVRRFVTFSGRPPPPP